MIDRSVLIKQVEKQAAFEAKAVRTAYADRMKPHRDALKAAEKVEAAIEREELKRIDRWRVASVARDVCGSMIAPHNRPMAATGLISYRCRLAFGFIMIGATDHADAFRQALRSSDEATRDGLDVWDGKQYVAVWRKRKIRHQPGFRGEQYMHRSLKPLAEVDFRTHAEAGQSDLFINECEGMCGV